MAINPGQSSPSHNRHWGSAAGRSDKAEPPPPKVLLRPGPSALGEGTHAVAREECKTLAHQAPKGEGASATTLSWAVWVQREPSPSPEAACPQHSQKERNRQHRGQGRFPAWREGFWVRRLPAPSTPCPPPGRTLATHLQGILRARPSLGKQTWSDPASPTTFPRFQIAALQLP